MSTERDEPRDGSDRLRLHEDDVKRIAEVVASLISPTAKPNPARGDGEGTSAEISRDKGNDIGDPHSKRAGIIVAM